MLFFPGLLPTGKIDSRLLAIRDGFVNMYIVKAEARLVCIDTGWRPGHVLREFKALQLDAREVAAVFLTHLHWDHARCTNIFPNAEIYASEQAVRLNAADKCNITRSWIPVRDNRQLTVFGIPVRVVSVPGHTAESVSYMVGGDMLFTGDCLRLKKGKVVPFHFFLNRDNTQLAGSIRKLAAVKGVEILLTAHTGITNTPGFAFAKWRDHVIGREERG